MGDVLDAILIGAVLAQTIEDLLPMGPGFHLPCRNRRPGTHVRPDPFDPLLGIRGAIAGRGCCAFIAPGLKQRPSFQTIEPDILRCQHRLALFQVGHNRGNEIVKPRFVFQRISCGDVEHVQVTDHIIDGPAFELGLPLKHRIITGRQQVMQLVAFGFEVLGLLQKSDPPNAQHPKDHKSR